MRMLELRDGRKKNRIFISDVLTEKDFKNFTKSYKLGEWCFVSSGSTSETLIGFIALKQNEQMCFHLIGQCLPLENIDIFKSILMPIIKKAFRQRTYFKDILNESRLFYGFSDGLPGLIIDAYANCVLVQISTRGVDLFRHQIKTLCESLLEKKVYFLDIVAKHSIEDLPCYSQMESFDQDISVVENDFRYEIPYSIVQKNGYYYDHRNNRAKLERVINNWTLHKKRGLDLFCYCGSWGMHLMRANVENVTFVDQGCFEDVIQKNIKANNLTPSWRYVREDAFAFLNNECGNQQYDVIVCDPPALSKSYTKKNMALIGYEKLYRGIVKLASSQALLALASCTYGITYQDLARIIQKIARENGYDLSMIDIGLQGMDHKFRDFEDKSFYIKYLLFFLDKEVNF